MKLELNNSPFCFELWNVNDIIIFNMKRYFTMSLTLFAFSVLNVLSYFLLGVITGNTAFAGIFSITYPLQYVVATFLCFFASASNIRANKEKNKNCISSGMILGLILGVIVFGIIAIFVDKYIAFMNMDANIFHNFTLMSIGQLFLAYVCNLVTEKLYYENKDKYANICSLGFIFLNLLTVIISALITKNQVAILLTNLVVLFIYASIWFGFNIKKFKFDFSVIKNFKYESMHIICEIFMLTIYLFGYRIVFGFGEEYYIALSFTNLISDSLWDAVGANSKIARIDISQSCYNYKRALKNSFMITVFYIVIGTILFFSLFKIYNVVLSIGLIYLAIQFAALIGDSVRQNIQNFLQLEYSPTKATLISLLSKGGRTILTIFLISPFNTDIAQITFDILGLILCLILRFRNFKLDESGFLIKKDKNNKLLKSNLI